MLIFGLDFSLGIGLDFSLEFVVMGSFLIFIISFLDFADSLFFTDHQMFSAVAQPNRPLKTKFIFDIGTFLNMCPKGRGSRDHLNADEKTWLTHEYGSNNPFKRNCVLNESIAMCTTTISNCEITVLN